MLCASTPTSFTKHKTKRNTIFVTRTRTQYVCIQTRMCGMAWHGLMLPRKAQIRIRNVAYMFVLCKKSAETTHSLLPLGVHSAHTHTCQNHMPNAFITTLNRWRIKHNSVVGGEAEAESMKWVNMICQSSARQRIIFFSFLFFCPIKANVFVSIAFAFKLATALQILQ